MVARGDGAGPVAPAPRAAAAGPFVGRHREMERLLAALDEVAAGRGSAFLLLGEPGIGKSRLVGEVVAAARERDCQVLSGSAWETGGAPAYWPWVQALRSLLREPAASLRRTLGDDAALLSALLPGVAARTDVTDAGERLDTLGTTEGARLRLFAAVSGALERAGSLRPVVVTLDDLHVADAPSLLLLRYVVGQLTGVRVLVMGTLRFPETDAPLPLRRVLGDLVREPAVRTLTLDGLTRDEVLEYIESTVLPDVDAGVAAVIHHETAGNPLFVSEVVHLLESEGTAGAAGDPSRRFRVPSTLREAIGRRLDPLPAPSRRLLTVASVLGRQFRLDTLARLGEVDEASALDHLDTAARAGIVTAAGTAPTGEWRFSHVLVRETVYESLRTGERLQMHQAAVSAIRAGSDVEARLSELAHHAYLSLPLGNPREAAELARRAAERALASLAYEEAVRLLGMALRALEACRGTSLERCDLLLALGDAQARAGELPASRDTFLQAATVARREADPVRLARAALGYGGRFAWLRAGGDPHLVPLLEEAITLLGTADPELQVRLLGRLSGALRDEASRERRVELSQRALDLARTIGDMQTLAYALIARYAAVWGPDDTTEGASLVDELEQTAERLGEPERVLDAQWLRFTVLSNAGADRAALERVWDRYRRIADELRQPSQRWYAGVMRTILLLLDGRFEDAAACADEALMLGRRAQNWDATASHRMAMFLVRREQSRLEEIEDAVRRSLAEYPGYRLFSCLLALVLAETGRPEQARTAIESVLAGGDDALPRDNGWLFGVAVMAEACGVLEDRSLAVRLYDLLLPYGDQVGLAAFEVCWGSTWRPLGIIAGLLGRHDEAEQYLERAMIVDTRMGGRPWIARTQYELGRVLLARGDSGRRSRALALLDEAEAAARLMGQDALIAQVERIRGRAPATEQPHTAQTETPPPRVGELRRHGEYWTLVFAGESTQLRDSKGLQYLARLLTAAGSEIAAVDLVVEDGGAIPDPRFAAGLAPPGDLGEVLDATARQSYRQRIAELEEDRADAERDRDIERASRAITERDILLHELAGAVGLGGRARRTGSDTERARLNASRAIRSAIDRIREPSPAAWRHLSATVHTGTMCAYMPDPGAPVVWHV